jgi:hypothetical protein
MQPQPSGRFHRHGRTLAVMSAAVVLAGCWTPPSADVQPGGRPRVIVRGIEVERVADSARVESIDRAARTVALSVHGVALAPCRIGPGVRNWRDLRARERVHAIIRELLTLYAAPAGSRRSADARVLTADPSYRLLTVEYANGATDTFKVGLHTDMEEIEAGDSVAIRPVEALALRPRRRPDREQSSRSGKRAAPGN